MSSILKSVAAQLNDVDCEDICGKHASKEISNLFEICKANNIIVCFTRIGGCDSGYLNYICFKGAREQEVSFNPRKGETHDFLIDSCFGLLDHAPKSNSTMQAYLSAGNKPITVSWNMFYYIKGGCPHWRYEFETKIKHETFEIQNGYCLGVVFHVPTKDK